MRKIFFTFLSVYFAAQQQCLEPDVWWQRRGRPPPGSRGQWPPARWAACRACAVPIARAAAAPAPERKCGKDVTRPSTNGSQSVLYGGPIAGSLVWGRPMAACRVNDRPHAGPHVGHAQSQQLAQPPHLVLTKCGKGILRTSSVADPDPTPDPLFLGLLDPAPDPLVRGMDPAPDL